MRNLQQFKSNCDAVKKPIGTFKCSARYNYEYECNGVSNLFMLFAPLGGWRHIQMADRHTNVDWAGLIKAIVYDHYPGKRKIVLVMDNLNTHKSSTLYEAFELAEARRITECLEIHFTPTHGNWLNMAEIEIGVIVRQCLDRRLGIQHILRNHINAWQKQRKEDAIFGLVRLALRYQYQCQSKIADCWGNTLP